MDIKIRLLQEADIVEAARFEQEISRIAFGEEAITDLDFHTDKLYKAFDKDSSGMFVLDVDGALCGWLWMDMKTNFLTKERYANFRSFYMTEAWRGSTESESLLEQGMNYARKSGARSVVGKVHADNLAMRALYKKAGFTATHITMEYHWPQQHD